MEGMYASVVITALLKRNRCYFVERGKAHDKWHSEITGKEFCVPRRVSKGVPTGTVTNILRDAGLS